MRLHEFASEDDVVVLDVRPLHKEYPGFDKLPPIVIDGIEVPQLWYQRKRDKLRICISGHVQDGRQWLHLSCSFKSKMPTYLDLAQMKTLFVGPDLPAYMVFPRKKDHYNFHQHCLHLWAPLTGEDPLPEFLDLVGAI